MAVKTNLKDIGWMYHSPAEQQAHQERMIPPTSQIPGMGGMPDSQFEPEQPRGYIKDTDTPYIIMAKQGGRRDLLNFRESKSGQSKEPKNYPRCDWFYLEDNQVEDTEANADREPWQFRLPDYMVHETRNRGGRQGDVPGAAGSRLPYATAMDMKPSDKMGFRLPELRKQGVGVRLAKANAKKPQKFEKITVPKPFHRLPENEAARPKIVDTFEEPMYTDQNVPSMHKLLSMGYQKEWCHARDQFETDQKEYARAQAERIARQARARESPRRGGAKDEPATQKQTAQQNYSHVQSNPAPRRGTKPAKNS